MEVVSHNATLPVAFSVIDGVNERRDLYVARPF
jgi:hypothetical protein